MAQLARMKVTSERIRDKVAASKKKDIRVGGPLPLGYLRYTARALQLQTNASSQ
jgi:hypothetical protein